MLAMSKTYELLQWGEEAGVIIKAVSPQIERRMSQEQTYVARVQYPSIRDKPTRARPLQARIAQGKLSIPKEAHWAPDLLSEMARFPAGKFDDQTDALALLSVVAATLGPPQDDDGASPLDFIGKR